MTNFKVCTLVSLMFISSGFGAFLTSYFSPNTAEAQLNMDFLRVKGVEVVDNLGKTRLSLGLVQEEPMISFLDAYGKPSLTLGVMEGSPSLFMFENQRPILGVGVELGGDTGYFVFDKYNNPIAAIGVDSNGGPIMVVKDNNGKAMASIGLYQGKPYIYVQDSNEKVIWSTPGS
ncbi:MAG: hypothetical protein HOL75_07095 [Nitrospina sp.]|nr:hypothetical protein [Nitrospina sp.]